MLIGCDALRKQLSTGVLFAETQVHSTVLYFLLRSLCNNWSHKRISAAYCLLLRDAFVDQVIHAPTAIVSPIKYLAITTIKEDIGESQTCFCHTWKESVWLLVATVSR